MNPAASPASNPLASLLAEKSIRLDESASDRDEAIRLVGRALVDSDAIDPANIDAMLEREKSVSTFVGEGIAFPHATFAGDGSVKKDAIAVLRFPAGIDWNGHDVRVAVGIAGHGRGHIALLSRLASLLLDPVTAGALRDARSAADVYALLDAGAGVDTDIKPPTALRSATDT